MKTAAGLWIVLLGAVVVLAVASVQARGAVQPPGWKPRCHPPTLPCKAS